jgi:hypothetical protein
LSGESEHILETTEFQGFPIVQDRNSKLLLGYINRTELKYGIGECLAVPTLTKRGAPY